MNALSRLPDNIAVCMRWPPVNGAFVLGFNPAVAARVKRDGWIVIDGQRARVRPASLYDDDERVDFQLEGITCA